MTYPHDIVVGRPLAFAISTKPREQTTGAAVSTSPVCAEGVWVDSLPTFSRHVSSFQHRRCRPPGGLADIKTISSRHFVDT